MNDKVRVAFLAMIISQTLPGSTIFAGLSEQQLGKNDIGGQVVDSKDGEALPYANVLIKGTNRGSTSNTNGYFVIVNVPVGICSLQVRYIGYAPKEIAFNNFQANTEELRIELEQSVLEGEDVTVYAEEYQIFKQTDEISKITLSTQKLSTLPNLGEEDIFRSLQLQLYTRRGQIHLPETQQR